MRFDDLFFKKNYHFILISSYSNEDGLFEYERIKVAPLHLKRVIGFNYVQSWLILVH